MSILTGVPGARRLRAVHPAPHQPPAAREDPTLAAERANNQRLAMDCERMEALLSQCQTAQEEVTARAARADEARQRAQDELQKQALEAARMQEKLTAAIAAKDEATNAMRAVLERPTQVVQSPAAEASAPVPAAPGPLPDFDLIIHRGTDGLLQRFTIKEKG